jgi:hypothetical protein
MYTAKHILVSVAAFLISVGTLCAQVCDVSCAFTGSAAAALTQAQQPSSPADHCHQSDAAPEPPASHDHDHSSGCQPHDYDVAPLKADKPTVATAYASGAPAAELFHSLGVAPEHLISNYARKQSCHSPPAPSRFAPLRI